jgi:plastocyanin
MAETRARKRSSLDVIMLVGLAIVVVANVVAMLIEGSVIPPVLITTLVYAICGIVVATGWRWAMILPLVFCTLGVIADFASGFPEYTLTHPSADYVPFTLFIISYPLLVMVIVAAALKLAQTIRHEAPHAPAWTKPALGAMLGLMLGAMLIGVSAQPPTGSGAGVAKAGTKTVFLAPDRFAPDIIALHKGDTLTIVDEAPIPHTITNGAWSGDNKPVPGVEPGAPIIKNVDLNNNTATVGPFTTAGTYHVYCTLHPGMSLTIIVQ